MADMPAGGSAAGPSVGLMAAAPPVGESRPARVGVVLAAGGSERLHELTGGGSKALVRLGGLPLVERAVRTLLSGGIEVVVVVGHQAGPVAAIVSRIGSPRVRTVLAERWKRGNGASLAAAEPVLPAGPFLLVTADHVFGEGALNDLLASLEPAVLVDPRPTLPVWAEGTRVRIREGRAVAFGKHLDEPAVDSGAFELLPDIFAFQRRAAAEGDYTLAGAVTRLAAERPLRVVPLRADAWWTDVDTPEDLRRARILLRRSLAKASDGPVSHSLNRPISTRVSMALAPLRPSPDIVSLLTFLLPVIAAGLLAVGAGVAGGLLVHVASVLDGTDGELARLQIRAGPRGAMLDGVLDRLGDAAILAGLAVWALDAVAVSPAAVLLLTAAATTGAMLSMATKDRAAALGLRPAPESGPSAISWAAATAGCCWSPWRRSWGSRGLVSPRWPRRPLRARSCAFPWSGGPTDRRGRARTPNGPSQQVRIFQNRDVTAAGPPEGVPDGPASARGGRNVACAPGSAGDLHRDAQGEILGLRWADFDSDFTAARVRRSLQVVRGELIFCEPKTPRSRRQIPLGPDNESPIAGRPGTMDRCAGRWRRCRTRRSCGSTPPRN
jgi:choline kinase/phosphatidylglycerophosphate synthase